MSIVENWQDLFDNDEIIVFSTREDWCNSPSSVTVGRHVMVGILQNKQAGDYPIEYYLPYARIIIQEREFFSRFVALSASSIFCPDYGMLTIGSVEDLAVLRMML